jgi:hypothetical protein
MVAVVGAMYPMNQGNNRRDPGTICLRGIAATGQSHTDTNKVNVEKMDSTIGTVFELRTTRILHVCCFWRRKSG